MIGLTLTLDAATPGDSGQRLDRFLASRLEDKSRSQLQEFIKRGRVSLDGATVTEASLRVKPGDRFTVDMPPLEPAVPQAENLPLTVIYEDRDLIVIDKPAGLVVHPAPGNRTGTLVNALIAHCGGTLSGIGGVMRPGIVHRLDKDTTGLMVIAKHDIAHRHLSAQFADHGKTGDMERGYFALVWGRPRMQKGVIDAPLGRHSADRTRMAVQKNGRHAVTYYSVARTYICDPEKRQPTHQISVLSCTLETGRTHQVRVHLAHIGHPVIADPLYAQGFASKTRVLPDQLQSAILSVKRQALHAEKLSFRHPASGRLLKFVSKIPDDIARITAALDHCH